MAVRTGRRISCGFNSACHPSCHTMLDSFVGPLIQLLPVAVSLIYFFTSPVTQDPARRVLASAHGIVVTAMYYTDAWLYELHGSSPRIGYAVAILILGWAALIGTAFGFYRGPRLIHLLLLTEIPCFAWAAFIGVLAASR